MQIKRIHDLIEPIIRAMGLELWACELHQQGRRITLRIFIDRHNQSGVSLDECVAVSREVGAILDVENAIQDRYELEVSSPGMERTLSTLPHFQRFLGEMVKIKLRVAKSGHRQFVARLEKIMDDHIILNIQNEIIPVTLGEIQKANLVASGARHE